MVMGNRRWRSTAAVLALTVAASPGAGALSQPAGGPDYKPGPDYAGVAGSAAENARITQLCGPNRNAADGYNPTPARPDQTKAPQVKSVPFSVEVVATLDRSVGMAFLPEGGILVSQRAGGLRLVDAKGQVSEPLKGAPADVVGAMGTSNTGPVLDKGFKANRILYYGYTAAPAAKGQPYVGRIVKAKLSADGRSLEEAKTIYEAPFLAPRRIVQARDGTLLIASAEVLDHGPNPQSMTDPRGKILRIGADGSVPKDNPYLKTTGADPALYAVGFRDIQGAGLDASGALWVAENEPRGGDELNRIKAGGNYGFPVISYGRENGGALINGGKTAQDGMEQPVYYWTPSIAPSGLSFYDGKAFPAWKGDVFVGGMSGKQLVRLKLKDGRVVGEEKLLMDRCKRTKDVREGPDGLIYVITDESPSEILRLVPAKR
jgi:glucose/arabinose dehydrogenase